MKKYLILAVIFIMIMGYAFAKENLAILPFTGGQGDEGETIAELFSFDAQFNRVFNPIPRTSISRAISRERGFQMDSGMTDPDTIISIANELGARYVVAGSITTVGNNKLLVISIIDIRNLQQIAGDYQTYNRIEEIRGKLPNMASNIIQATQTNTTALPKLAIVPVQMQGGTDQRIAGTLAQLLAIYLIRSGIYAVFPRTESLNQVMDEHRAQMQGHTADHNVIGIGHGENPDYVLSVVARRLGESNMFNASIINLETRSQIVGRSVDYQNIDDGMRAMETLATDLISSSDQVTQRRSEEEERQRREEQERLAAERRAEATDKFLKNSGIELGVRLGIALEFGSGHKNADDPLYINLPLAISMGLKLDAFTLESGFQFNFRGNDNLLYDFIQIPLLAKFTFSPANFVFSPFAGIGFNIPIFDSKEWDDVSLPISGIVGMNIGLLFNKTKFFTDMRYVFDIGATKAQVTYYNPVYYSGGSYDYIRTHWVSSFDVSLGVQFIIPFRK